MMHPFEILAEPVRRRIVEVLAVGSHPVGMITDVITMEFQVSRSAVSHHLKILREQQVVRVIPACTERLYLLEEEFMLSLDQAVDELFNLWDHRYGFGNDRAPLPPEHPSRAPRMPHPPRTRNAPHPHRAGRKGRRGFEPGKWLDDAEGE
ncbi:ArsR/SmtB family transcription factor [Agromyces italicus]|uniref:ArsR/SmtB family transcription factor n=1 Tax=Agromyces italicus TaxID=279572 RepID=UPI0003B5A5AA|nr:metalloregulator ArsR/SmtB family transcription factor [Agromyces italicus]